MVVIVESPYQLLNALSLLDKIAVNLRDCHIFIRDNGNQKQKKQISNLGIDGNLKYFYLPSKGVMKLPCLFLFYVKYATLLFFSKNIIIGDARSVVSRPFLKLLRKKLFFVDDGFYLISHIEKLRNCNCTIFTSLPINRKLEDRCIILRNELPEIMHYESNESVSFVGQPLVELGFINSKLFIEHLKNVLKYFSTDFTHFNYFAHRNELSEKLDDIKAVGFKIIHLPMSMESYFHHDKAPSGVFLSYYSTALFNISLAHKNADFYFINHAFSVGDKSINDTIETCQKVFLDSGIKQLNL